MVTDAIEATWYFDVSCYEKRKTDGRWRLLAIRSNKTFIWTFPLIQSRLRACIKNINIQLRTVVVIQIGEMSVMFFLCNFLPFRKDVIPLTTCRKVTSQTYGEYWVDDLRPTEPNRVPRISRNGNDRNKAEMNENPPKSGIIIRI